MHICVTRPQWVNVNCTCWLQFCSDIHVLTHWSWVTHICIGNLTIIGSENGFPPGWRQAIIWTNDWILLIKSFGTNFSDIFNKIYIFLFRKMHLNMSSANWQPFCLGLNALIVIVAGCRCLGTRHCLISALITLRPGQMAAISHTTFSNAFYWMTMYEFWLRFHWSLFLRVQLTIFQHWFK